MKIRSNLEFYWRIYEVFLGYFNHKKCILGHTLETRPRRPGFKGHPIEFMIILEPYFGPICTHMTPFGPIET